MEENTALHKRIVELAGIMAAPEEEERPLLEALCTAAETASAGRLREGLTPESCGPAYLCATAMIAAAGLTACRDDGGVEQFTAGEVTVRTGGGGGCEAGAALRRQAAGLMAEYWRDDGFAFVGVKG